MLIDIHTHILPNVDDGSNSIEMSEKMIQNSVEENVKCIFLTPHHGIYLLRLKHNPRLSHIVYLSL